MGTLWSHAWKQNWKVRKQEKPHSITSAAVVFHRWIESGDRFSESPLLTSVIENHSEDRDSSASVFQFKVSEHRILLEKWTHTMTAVFLCRFICWIWINECLLEVFFRDEKTLMQLVTFQTGLTFMKILHFTLISQQIWNDIWRKIKWSLLPGPWGFSCLFSWQWNPYAC